MPQAAAHGAMVFALCWLHEDCVARGHGIVGSRSLWGLAGVVPGLSITGAESNNELGTRQLFICLQRDKRLGSSKLVSVVTPVVQKKIVAKTVLQSWYFRAAVHVTRCWPVLMTPAFCIQRTHFSGSALRLHEADLVRSVSTATQVGAPSYLRPVRKNNAWL